MIVPEHPVRGRQIDRVRPQDQDCVEEPRGGRIPTYSRSLRKPQDVMHVARRPGYDETIVAFLKVEDSPLWGWLGGRPMRTMRSEHSGVVVRKGLIRKGAPLGTRANRIWNFGARCGRTGPYGPHGPGPGIDSVEPGRCSLG